MSAEGSRIIANLCQFGIITQTKSIKGQALARVKIDDRETDFFPIISQSNSFKKHFIPSRENEQVAVFCPFGEANIGFILRGVFNKDCKEPNSSNNNKEIIEYEDGTVISYDTKAKELKINASSKITIICKEASVKADSVDVISKSVSVTADTVDITATTSNTGDVTINGSLTVSGAIVGSGGLAVSGGSGASISGDISSTGSLTVDGSISDSNGDLTNHSNNGM